MSILLLQNYKRSGETESIVQDFVSRVSKRREGEDMSMSAASRRLDLLMIVHREIQARKFKCPPYNFLAGAYHVNIVTFRRRRQFERETGEVSCGYRYSHRKGKRGHSLSTATANKRFVECLHEEYTSLGVVRDNASALDLIKQLNDEENVGVKTGDMDKHWFLQLFLQKMIQDYGLQRIGLDPNKQPPVATAEDYSAFLARFERERGTGDTRVPPANIFLVDETNYSDTTKKSNFLVLPPDADAGAEPFTRVVTRNMKTVVETVSAAGQLLAPFLQLPNGDALWAQRTTLRCPDDGRQRVDIIDLGWSVQAGSTNGWLSSANFYDYLVHFHAQTKHLPGKRILLLDNPPTSTSRLPSLSISPRNMISPLSIYHPTAHTPAGPSTWPSSPLPKPPLRTFCALTPYRPTAASRGRRARPTTSFAPSL